MEIRSISLGAGVQSTTLYLLACRGEIGPKPDVAIFADTQQEPPWVYKNLDRLSRMGDIPIHRVSAGDLGTAVLESLKSDGNRFASVPFWVSGSDGRGSPGRRQCTREYKIDAITQELRRMGGLKKGEKATGKLMTEEWIGISCDEVQRAKSSRYSWVKTRWPLIEKRWRRSDCVNYLEGIGYPVPNKSACIFCPYRSLEEYAVWARNYPDLFNEACEWDERLRDGSARSMGMKEPQYISRALVPLRIAVDNHMSDKYEQCELFDYECDGMCGV